MASAAVQQRSPGERSDTRDLRLNLFHPADAHAGFGELRALFMKLRRFVDLVTTRSSALIIVSALGVTPLSLMARAQPFEPISELATWYTDRHPIDVEIFATTGEGTEARRLDPERKLLFRFERANVGHVVRIQRPPYSSVMMSVDMPTGLPSQLLIAPPEQVEARGEEIPRMDHAASVKRTLNIVLGGKQVVEVLMRVSSNISRCRGESEGDDLFVYEGSKEESCKALSLGGGKKYIARLSDEVSLFVNCSSPQPIGCAMSFPFEGFAPSVSFNESHLRSWRSMLDAAISFLHSKQYR
jgi:hypothetical protein